MNENDNRVSNAIASTEWTIDADSEEIALDADALDMVAGGLDEFAAPGGGVELFKCNHGGSYIKDCNYTKFKANP